MRNLVEIFNTNDLRYLLDVDELPDDYNISKLIPVFDEILKEYEQLRGDKFYTKFIQDSDTGIREAAKLTIIRGCYELLLCGKRSEAYEILSKIKIKSRTLNELEFDMKKITQDIQIKAMKKGDKKEEKQNFGAMCANIKMTLNIDVKDDTVAEFCEYEKQIKKQREWQNSNNQKKQSRV